VGKGWNAAAGKQGPGFRGPREKIHPPEAGRYRGVALVGKLRGTFPNHALGLEIAEAMVRVLP